MYILDKDLEKQTTWETHTGPEVSGTPNPPLPTATGWSDRLGAREFFVKGPGGADVLYAIHRPVQAKSGIVHLTFNAMFDENSLSQMRCFEVDSILSSNKLKSNCSSQFNFNSGMLDVSGQDGGWVSTGIPVHKFIPYQGYAFKYKYSFDTKYSLLSVTVSEDTYVIPTNLQNLTPITTNWADVLSLQIQLDLDTSGGGFSTFVRKVDYIWEV